MKQTQSVVSRATRQRAAISAALEQADTFQTAQELFEALRLEGQKIGLTTVYRNLQSMATRGEVDVLRREDGESIYRRCEMDEHHHHLVCRECGVSVELENAEIERWTTDVAKGHRFTDVTHDLVLFGVCSECASRRKKTAGD
jgi:Fur family ferric uptake transcriptional regulator